ncbi:uncharacterized protein UTRI_02308 [Ustilago trichophora]|uniref:Uncharacterized protein n=1 Tax=Ustilago trichophora TaxID=86804 RepID=A0A5C3E5N8_9BASI|nr:uncharacterized protein UTRI_02308 [Ustilago trichophora]
MAGSGVAPLRRQPLKVAVKVALRPALEVGGSFGWLRCHPARVASMVGLQPALEDDGFLGDSMASDCVSRHHQPYK